MSERRPLILVSNDDGIHANGVHELIDMLLPLGDVVCICPDTPQSGKSMALTVDRPLTITPVADYHGARMYRVNGTPVDCVKLGFYTMLEQRSDLVVAGINHGSNASVNVLYSGTMGAAFEGTLFGVPSVGFSLTDHDPNADFSACKRFVVPIVQGVLAHGLPEGVALNVNIPNCRPAPTEMRVVRACKGNWSDEYVEYTGPHNRKYYFLTGVFENAEPESDDTDEWTLAHGMVAVTPVSVERSIPVDTPSIAYLHALRPLG